MKITAMYIENLLSSLLKDSGIGCEGYLSSDWDNYFEHVKPVQESNNSKAPNTQNLSVWRDGRGSFSDYCIDGYFIDWKGCKSEPKLNGKKVELWAGRPSKSKSKNYAWDEMTTEEIKTAIIEEYHQNKVGLQIHESLTDNDRPYIIGFVWPTVDSNCKIVPVVQLVNITKLWSHASVSDNAIGRRFFQLRVKGVYNKIGSTVVSMSYCARVECKFKKEQAFEHLAAMGAITKPHLWTDTQEMLKTII